MSSKREVRDKVFFITGGAQGFGKVLMEAVLQRGAKAFFVDIQKETGTSTLQEFRERFGADNVAFALADVAIRSELEDAFKEAKQTFGYIDVVLNNAAIADETKTKRTVDVNFLGVIQGTELGIEYMRKDKGGRGGRIVAMSSKAGLIYCFPMPVYNAAKHGIRVYTKALSQNPANEAMGLEFATFHPDGSTVGIFTNLGGRGIPKTDEVKAAYAGKIVPIEDVIEAFVELVTLEKMNGADLFLAKDKKVYAEVESREMGDKYPPDPSQTPGEVIQFPVKLLQNFMSDSK